MTVKARIQVGTIGYRLAEVRGTTSTRETRRRIKEAAGFTVSHGAVLQREKGANVPADYLIAFAVAFDANPVWLLIGQGAKRWHRSSVDRQRAEDALGYIEHLAAGLRDELLRGEEEQIPVAEPEPADEAEEVEEEVG